MSSIRFHFGEGETLEVRGMERAMMGAHVQNIAAGVGHLATPMGSVWADRDVARLYGKFLGLTEAEIEDPRPLLSESVGLSLSAVGDRRTVFSWKGKEISSWSLALNTALAVGSDPIRLSAKIHGTCEIHGFFEGKDRDWLAGLIEEGLEEGVFREEFKPNHESGKCYCGTHSMGWIELIEQLRQSDEHAVVMSYSVTDGFPDPPKDWRPEVTGDERYAQWYELSDWKRFDLALTEVRNRGDNEPIGPKTLRALRFTHDLSLLDLMAGDIEKIEKKLGIAEGAE